MTQPAPPTPFAPQYRDNWYPLAPPWLRTGNGELYMYALQAATDILLDRARQAIELRLPGVGGASNLPYLSYDRQLVQGPGETPEAFASRLQGFIATWNASGSRQAVLGQVQAYLSGLQPGVPSSNRLAVIVGGYYGGAFGPSSNATWDWLTVGAEPGATPAHLAIWPSNFNWDGLSRPWRDWLILPMALVEVTNGTGASTGTAAPSACFTSPGMMGSGSLAGVWVPATSGTPVNSPWLTVEGVAGEIGQWLTLSGSSNPGNNGTFPIVSIGPTVIANPSGVASDAGPLTWSISEYPFLAPAPVWGAPGLIFGLGQAAVPPPGIQPHPAPWSPTGDTGSNVGGVWQPTTPSQSYAGTLAWGLASNQSLCPYPFLTISAIRSVVSAWKSARSAYQNIIVSFGNNEYSPAPGAVNPTGTSGSRGMNVGGQWVPSGVLSSAYDAICQGTGRWQNCSEQNVT